MFDVLRSGLRRVIGYCRVRVTCVWNGFAEDAKTCQFLAGWAGNCCLSEIWRGGEEGRWLDLGGFVFRYRGTHVRVEYRGGLLLMWWLGDKWRNGRLIRYHRLVIWEREIWYVQVPRLETLWYIISYIQYLRSHLRVWIGKYRQSKRVAIFHANTNKKISKVSIDYRLTYSQIEKWVRNVLRKKKVG